MKKIFAFMTALAILLTSAACSSVKPEEEGPKEAEKTEAVPAEAEQSGAGEETEAPETEIPDNLPARDFAGQALRIAAEPDKEFEIRSEELNGEITNDVIYNRNVGIEERFNARIESVILSAGQKDNIQNNKENHVTASGPDHRAFRRSDRIFRARLHFPRLRDRSGLRRKSSDGRSQPLWKLRRTVCAYGKNE